MEAIPGTEKAVQYGGTVLVQRENSLICAILGKPEGWYSIFTVV